MSDVLAPDQEAAPKAAPVVDFMPWAIGAGANVTPLPTYKTSSGLSVGVVTGIADPLIYNRAVRQATFIAAGLAQFTANSTGLSILDDGNLAEFVTNFTNAISVTNDVPLFATNAQALAGTNSGTMISPSSLNYTLEQLTVFLTPTPAGSVQTINGPLTIASPYLFRANGGATIASSLTISAGAVVTFPNQSLSGLALALNSVDNTRLADMPSMTVKANITGVSGDTNVANPVDVSLSAFVKAANAVIPTYSHFQNRQANTATSGENSIPSGSHATRILNWANPANNIPGASGTPGGPALSGNQVILPAGTYKARAFATAVANGPVSDLKHQLSIRNVGNNAALCTGVNTQWASGSATQPTVTAHVQGMFILAGPGTTTVCVSSFCANGAGASSNGGQPCNSVVPADNEVYVDVIFEKIA